MPTAPVSASNIAAQTLQRNAYNHKQPTSSTPSPQNGYSVSRSLVGLPREGEGSWSGSTVEERASIELTPAADRQLFVFCDPVAFRYLEDEPCVTVVYRQRTLPGYSLYLVEQWACSRIHPTFVIATYTGDPSHIVCVGVLDIPLDESQWSPRLRVYFKAVEKFHARPKQTPIGTVMVTNLSSFPSALTVVAVPDGNMRKHRQDFIVNEDLKRMGCSGRSAMSLTKPGDASQTKFHQLFRTSDRIPFYTAVIELVRLCQIALTLFEQLKPEYADGLLCDITERGIYDWWTQFGTDFYNIEPNDGIMGPTTVAALLGMVLGARNRLSSCGAPVPKDAFDIPQFKKAIYHFQRQQRIPRTRRLDRQTMDRLQRFTMKNGTGASGDIFAVPRAIKSTVVDLGGRAVGSSSNKVEGSAVETTDIEKFVLHLTGETCKFLWQGKPRKSVPGVGSMQSPPEGSKSRRNSLGDGSISEEEQVGKDISENPVSPIANQHSSNGSVGSGSAGASSNPSDTKDATGVSDLRKAVFKTMTGRMKDVASGISAGADYVRGRGQHQRSAPTKESHSIEGAEFQNSIEQSGTITQRLNGGSLKIATGAQLNRFEKEGQTAESPTTSILKMSFQTESPTEGVMTGFHSVTGSIHEKDPHVAEGHDEDVQEYVDARPGSDETFPTEYPLETLYRNVEIGLQRRKSFTKVIGSWETPRHEEYWPRRLSFSIAEEAILDWVSLSDITKSEGAQLPSLKLMRCLAEDIPTLSKWVERKITTVENLHQYLSTTLDDITAIRNSQSAIVADMEDAKRDVLERQKEGLREAVREVEVIGARMQYELGNVRGKMTDVEDALRMFARSVEEVEARASMIGLREERKVGWIEWGLGLALGWRPGGRDAPGDEMEMEMDD
ncbi:uncharacterized protein H6S33_003458 [Morchella sextelata]|uniref:uncharacterized protein n=1 Tax=Morchella sextelata TaxID=1174677 RepID=UPI001D051FCD|nr:uncharacterized protein H6S33_003458 [Morchella sextelata]KAH0606624.1 hypothetical protein H6S33_003458 [Morchella sextelata]